MPTIGVVSAHNLSRDFDRPTRPYVTVHLGGLKLGKTSVLFEASDKEGMVRKPRPLAKRNSSPPLPKHPLTRP